MTLSVSVVGKYIDDVEDHVEKGESELYQVNPDDPNILSMELDSEVHLKNMNFQLFNSFTFLHLITKNSR